MTERMVFAAERRGIQDRAADVLRPAVVNGLTAYGDGTAWMAPIMEAVGTVWASVQREEDANVDVARFAEGLIEALSLTTQPTSPPSDAQVDRITLWLSAYIINASTLAAVEFHSEGDVTLEWVTMDDDDVRHTHRVADGQVVLAGEPFTVGGYELRVPGEPVGPPEVWINCRCVVRPSGGNMPEEFAAETEEVVVAPPAEEEVVVEDDTVRWHGVIAPTNVTSADRRRLASGGLTTRDLPLPLKWMKYDDSGHDKSFIVANIERLAEKDGKIYGEGRFARTEEAQEVIGLVADGMLRGVSVDLDKAVASLQNQDGSAFNMEEYVPGESPEPITAVENGRVAAATLCSIPAFAGAYLALGPWEEDIDADDLEVEQDEALVASGGCIPCEAAEALEAAYEALGADEFRAKLLAAVGEFAPGTKDGPGWLTNPKETQQLRTYWTKGAGAAKIRWGTPGDFNRCRTQLAKYVTNPEWLAGTCANLHKVALGFWPGQEGSVAASATPPADALVASAFTMIEEPMPALTAAGAVRPAVWFTDPELTGPTPLTITDEGHIYGHVATWGVCHIASGPLGGECITAPNSHTNYAYFRTGVTKTDMGEIAVGHVTMGIGHADLSLSGAATLAHYDNTDAVVADIVAGEDKHGIWFSGALRPGLEDDKIEALRAAALSGDWRDLGAGLEMVAALAVNVPGFPIPRLALAASGAHTDAVVGISPVRQPEVATVEALDVKSLVSEVIQEMNARAEHEAQVKAFRSLDTSVLVDPEALRIREAFLQ